MLVGSRGSGVGVAGMLVWVGVGCGLGVEVKVGSEVGGMGDGVRVAVAGAQAAAARITKKVSKQRQGLFFRVIFFFIRRCWAKFHIDNFFIGSIPPFAGDGAAHSVQVFVNDFGRAEGDE